MDECRLAGCSAVEYAAAGYPLACSYLVTEGTKDQVSVRRESKRRGMNRALDP